jgi:hypothetical protein
MLFQSEPNKYELPPSRTHKQETMNKLTRQTCAAMAIKPVNIYEMVNKPYVNSGVHWFSFWTKVTSKIKQHISHSAVILRIDYLYHTLHLRTIILPKHVDQVWHLWFDVRSSPDICLLIFYQRRQQFSTKETNTLNFPINKSDSILLDIGKLPVGS